MRASAIYEGEVRHTRLVPRPRTFVQRLYMLYLDLDELPELFRGRLLWSHGRRNLVWFRRDDYLGPAELPLREAVLRRVEAQLGHRPAGPVRMLTHLRTFGYVFNPVTFYTCHDADGELEAIVAEITNTPWRERHAYVLDARGGRRTWRFDKAFHVSPFQDMGQEYEWTFGTPGERLEVRMRNHERGERVFDVGLACERREITAASLARVLVRYPLMTLRVHAAIYWQAARRFLERTPFFVHPTKRAEVRDASTS